MCIRSAQGLPVPRSVTGRRPPSASEMHFRAHQHERIENAPHRAFAQRGIAVEGHGHVVAAGDPHHESRASARHCRNPAELPVPAANRRPSRRSASGLRPAAPTLAPKARQASAVRSTSPPSSKPSTRVRPMASKSQNKRTVRHGFVARRAQDVPGSGRYAAPPGAAPVCDGSARLAIWLAMPVRTPAGRTSVRTGRS